jgi:hypothetical protein
VLALQLGEEYRLGGDRRVARLDELARVVELALPPLEVEGDGLDPGDGIGTGC